MTPKGFTLIELLTAIAIIGVLAAIGLPFYLSQVKKARYAEANLIMGAIATDLKVYQAANDGVYPNDVVRNVAPQGVGTFPIAPFADTPWKVFDFDNYVRDARSPNCFRQVQIVFLGENGDRETPQTINGLQALGVQAGVVNQVGDDRVLVVAAGECGEI